MIGKNVENEQDRELLVNALASWFKREPHWLQLTLRKLIDQDPDMRKILFSIMVDVPQVHQIFTEQNLCLKYGGRIPDKRWRMQFSPILQRSVEFLHYAFAFNCMY